MKTEKRLEEIADRVLAWAAKNPASKEEVEQQYGHLLAKLKPLAELIRERDQAAASPVWSIAKLGRLVVRYCSEKIEAIEDSIGGAALVPAIAMRGGSAEAPTSPSQKAEALIFLGHGVRADAQVKIVPREAAGRLDVVCWLVAKSGGAFLPFTLTVTDQNGTMIAQPALYTSPVTFSDCQPGEFTFHFATDSEQIDMTLPTSFGD